MEITLLQGILLTIMTIIVGLDFFLEAFFIFRPLIVSTLTGLILGDITLGLKVGALIELAFAGLTPAGGTQPPNPVFAGLMGTVLAYTTGCDPKAALGLCLPFSFLGQYVILFYYSAFSFFMGKADKCAAEADVKGIRRINFTTMTIISLTYGALAFLCTYVAQQPMADFVNALPAVITHGLEVAGGILPAVGFAMLLRVMMKVKYTPYFIAGFLMACFCEMPNLLPVALLGTVFALITMLGIRSSFLQASFNYERMQACGFTWAMLPALEKVYGDDKEKLSAAMTDNLEFINTHPNLVGFLMGLMMSLEEGGGTRDAIKGLKLALFGPIAGIGDAIFWFTILPIVAGISCSFASQGSVLGPIIFFATYVVIWILRIVWTRLGYTLGTRSIDIITENSDMIANSATILGITVIGALIASYVTINLLPVIKVDGGIEVAVQAEFFDRIFPNFLPMCVILLLFWLLKKKQANPIVLIVSIIVLSILGAWIGLV